MHKHKTVYLEVDQITNLINGLKTNPDSRRLMVSAWNVGELDEMVLPPCHYGFQVYTRELSLEERLDWLNVNIKNPKGTFISKLPYEHLHSLFEKHSVPKRAISLMWNQRSVDTGLGLGFNTASYGLLLEMIAKQVNMIPDELIGNLGDVHLYRDHIEPIKEQLNREPFGLPTLKIHGGVDDISHYEVSNFELIDYQSHPTIKLPLSN
jgi:thymidylate synthase